MRFINSSVLALLVALLASVALSEVIHDPQSTEHQNGPKLLAKRARKDLGPDKRSEDTKDFMKKYCNRGIEDECNNKRDLYPRARPNGFTDVPLDQVFSAGVNDPGMWTGGIGTCVAIAITGWASDPAARTKFLLHTTLFNWEEVSGRLNTLANQVDASIQRYGLSRLEGTMVMIDTTLSMDEQATRDEEFVQQEAKESEQMYAQVESWLSYFIGSPIRKEKHSFARTVEMTVTGAGVVQVRDRF